MIIVLHVPISFLIKSIHSHMTFCHKLTYFWKSVYHLYIVKYFTYYINMKQFPPPPQKKTISFILGLDLVFRIDRCLAGIN